MFNSLEFDAYRRLGAECVPPHVVALIQERPRRLAVIPHYDRLIAQTAGHPTLQSFWRRLKRQDLENAQWVENWLDREIADGTRWEMGHCEQSNRSPLPHGGEPCSAPPA